MTKDIISMAREAGLCMANDEWPLMQTFATLVKAAQVDELVAGVEMPEPVAWELFFYNGNSQGYTGNKGEAAEFGEEADPLFTADQMRDYAAAAVAKKDAEIAKYKAHGVTCQIYGHVVGACSECNTHSESADALKAELAQRDAHIVEYNVRIQAEMMKLLTEKDAIKAENEKLRDAITSIKVTTMHQRRFGAETLNAWRSASVDAETTAEEAMKGQP